MTSRDIVLTGMVDDETKWGLLRGAHALVAPSPVESFSLTVIEGMTAGAPAIVNAVCGATREHCEQSGAGMWFEGYAEFEAVARSHVRRPRPARDHAAERFALCGVHVPMAGRHGSLRSIFGGVRGATPGHYVAAVNGTP